MGYGEFSIGELKRRFGDATVARGRAYAGQGRVTKIVRQSAGDVLLAEVRGSGTSVYTTVVRDAAGPSSVSGECSCPMRGDCKHVVAVLLAARSEERPRSARPPAESWRRSLTALIEAAPRRQVRAQPLALQLTRTEPRRLGGGRVAVRSRLKARPLVLGSRGNWIKTGATWRDMEQRNDAGQVPAHRALMREVQASVRGPHLQGGYYNAQDDLDLDSSTADLWRLLDRAAALGVALVDSEGRETIELAADPAVVVIDVGTTEPGDLRLRARAVLGEERIDLHDAAVELLGAPAHGLFTWATSTPETRLIRFAEPLSGPLAAFAREHPITVPAERSAEFFAEFYPALVRSAEIASLDGSAELPEIRPPRLTLTVDFPAHGTARLRWRFSYRRGETVVYAELDSPSPGPSWRDRAAENAALAELELPEHLLAGLAPLSSATATGYDVVVLIDQVLPWLTDRGQVDVVVEGERPEFRAAQEDPLISLQVRDAPGDDDWFDLGVEITVEGENVGFAELFVALATGKSHLVLPSGLYLPIDRPEFARLRELIGEARALAPGDDDTLRVSRFQAGLAEEFAELGVIEVQSQRWRDSVEALIGLETLPEPDLPATLRAELRPYQRDGYAWLSFLHDRGLGGILADDMGLGKTLQALALISRAREADPRARFCVVAPTSVVENWAREAARFTPDLEVATIWQTTARRKESLAQAVDDAGLVITSYALFRLEFDDYEALGFDGLLLDEAQFVKNRQSKTYQCARRLSAPFKLAMTGTPLENSLMDLWSLLSIVAPGLYPQPQAFADFFAKPIEGGQAPERLETLRRRIRPLMRRRTKAEVLTELPPKQEQIVQIPLDSRHARIYDQHLQRERQKVLGLLDDVDSHRFAILRSLTLLRQLSLDPALIDAEYEGVGSAKADALIEQIEELVAEGHRALVFSQFTGYLARIRARLDAAQIPHAYLDGKTRRRQEVIEEFRSGAVPVFLISLKAGGFGLNLTEADYCFVLDPWWNPAAEQQAVDRAHRIGQTNTVMVYRFVSAGTIEDKVMALQERKRDLFDSVMGSDGALSGALDADDLRGLFDG